MTKKEELIILADNFIRDKGFNAFSYYDLAKAVGIKTSSIHYHFPTKADLGVAIVQRQLQKLNELKESVADKSPLVKLKAFFLIYKRIKDDHKICLVGSLATDFNTIDVKVQDELKIFSEHMLSWVAEILSEGKNKKDFRFKISPRVKAMMIITNMLALVQLIRLTSEEDFEKVQKAIIDELTEK